MRNWGDWCWSDENIISVTPLAPWPETWCKYDVFSVTFRGGIWYCECLRGNADLQRATDERREPEEVFSAEVTHELWEKAAVKLFLLPVWSVRKWRDGSWGVKGTLFLSCGPDDSRGFTAEDLLKCFQLIQFSVIYISPIHNRSCVTCGGARRGVRVLMNYL